MTLSTVAIVGLLSVWHKLMWEPGYLNEAKDADLYDRKFDKDEWKNE